METRWTATRDAIFRLVALMPAADAESFEGRSAGSELGLVTFDAAPAARVVTKPTEGWYRITNKHVLTSFKQGKFHY
jgi:hypothetical protein